ncbi:MAG: cytochrome P450 [Chloroflexi bacterium]|nr:MAG: cytochrome P450 [Chloroflexota bacterium]
MPVAIRTLEVDGRRALTSSAFREFQKDRLAFLMRCAETADVVHVRLGAEDVLVVSRPELATEVMLTRRADFSKAYLTSIMPPLLAGSLLLADSDSWLHQRKLMLPAFHKERLDTYAAVMAEESERAIATWQPGQRRDIHSEMMRLTLQIVTRSLFGLDFSHGVEATERLIDALMDEVNSRIASPFRFRYPLPTFRTLRLYRAMKELDEIAYTAIRERRRHPQEDLMSMLVGATDEDGTPMTDREVRDACLAVFFAGHETTACLLSWTWYVLAGREDIVQKLLAELAGAKSAPPAELIERLPYMQNVLNEALRLYPPAYAFGRRAVRDTRVGDDEVKAGQTVVMSPWAMHRDARFWDEPEKFTPDRWQNNLAARLPKFTFFPFSSGPRRCVGSSFAMLEATIAIATILPRFKLSSPPSVVEPAPSITLRPGGGMPMTISRRKSLN